MSEKQHRVVMSFMRISDVDMRETGCFTLLSMAVAIYRTSHLIKI